jgi:hypothetical protein
MKRLAVIFDVASVVLFVAIGRSAHQHGITWAGMASTTWPFATGLAVGWFVVLRSRRAPTTPTSGLVIVPVMVAVAMVLRVLSGQGTAFAFVIVALVFLALFLVGWRTVVPLINRHRPRVGD